MGRMTATGAHHAPARHFPRGRPEFGGPRCPRLLPAAPAQDAKTLTPDSWPAGQPVFAVNWRRT